MNTPNNQVRVLKKVKLPSTAIFLLASLLYLNYLLQDFNFIKQQN